MRFPIYYYYYYFTGLILGLSICIVTKQETACLRFDPPKPEVQ